MSQVNTSWPPHFFTFETTPTPSTYLRPINIALSNHALKLLPNVQLRAAVANLTSESSKDLMSITGYLRELSLPQRAFHFPKEH